jgi:hypothetical protein
MRRRDDGDDDSLPVMVPRSDKGLAAIAPERVRRLREHLIEALGTAKRWEHFASLERPGPYGFEARVARTACSLCKGSAASAGPVEAPTAFKGAVIGIE